MGNKELHYLKNLGINAAVVEPIYSLNKQVSDLTDILIILMFEVHHLLDPKD